MKSSLIIFTRYPIPGLTKTRLIPALGAEGASDLQRQMTERTVASTLAMADTGVRIQIRFEGSDRRQMAAWLGEDHVYEPQGEGDLGERMKRAFTDVFREGVERAVVIGTDCPSLGSKDIFEAFDLLENNTLVLGPATDGGYYLIGMRADHPPWIYDLIFRGIPWGTSRVFNATMNVLAETRLDVGLLDERADVDEPEDLVHWDGAIGTQDAGRATHEKADISISVIVPVYNEEEHIRETLNWLRTRDVEIIVADGGSTDGTAAVCSEAGVKVVHSEPGRAVQMNTGAAAATGNVFLFLHADTRLPDGFADGLRDAVAQNAAGGAFLFGTDMKTPSMRIIENAVHFRSIRLGIVFGDQAIFATREAFFRAGTYPEQPIMEDLELWKRLGRVGRRTIIPLSVTTSARKWRENGVWRTVLLHQAVMWLYLLGVSPERLGGWYRRKTGGNKVS